MTVGELIDSGLFKPLSVSHPEREINGAYIGDLLSWVMGRAETDNAWITIMSNVNVIAVASLTDVACVIFAEGVIPEESIIATAKEKGINLIVSEMPIYATAKELSALKI